MICYTVDGRAPSVTDGACEVGGACQFVR
jgi:hypothetical protein